MSKHRFRRLLLATSFFPVAELAAQSTVIGTVTDSVSHHPLAGALIQLVADSNRMVKTASSDSLGAFRVDSVPRGAYIIGFFHPALDSLGLDLLPRRVVVRGDHEQRVDLAIPSAWTLEHDLCRGTPMRDSTGLLLGHVRDADTQQPRIGTVTVQWMELTIGQGGIQQNRRLIPIKTDSLGWFALCGLPSDGEMFASAQAGDQESGLVSVRVPAGGLLVRDLQVSHDSTVALFDDTTAAAVATRQPITTLRRGSARLTGVVRNDKGKPVNNADVSVPGSGVQAKTQQSGEYALAGLPGGTQTVEVRVIGFEPKRVAVDLTRGHLTTLDIALDRPVQTLDAVKVYGKGNSAMAEFAQRVKAGWGHFLTPADIQKRNAVQVTDLFRTMPGVRVAPSRRGFGDVLLLRGNCLPTVYINGMRMDDSAAAHLDEYATPSEITGVEVYNTAGRPAEFWGNNCGSVVIWAGMLPR